MTGFRGKPCVVPAGFSAKEIPGPGGNGERTNVAVREIAAGKRVRGVGGGGKGSRCRFGTVLTEEEELTSEFRRSSRKNEKEKKERKTV